jgi:hypothetical protein
MSENSKTNIVIPSSLLPLLDLLDELRRELEDVMTAGRPAEATQILKCIKELSAQIDNASAAAAIFAKLPSMPPQPRRVQRSVEPTAIVGSPKQPSPACRKK